MMGCYRVKSFQGPGDPLMPPCHRWRLKLEVDFLKGILIENHKQYISSIVFISLFYSKYKVDCLLCTQYIVFIKKYTSGYLQWGLKEEVGGLLSVNQANATTACRAHSLLWKPFLDMYTVSTMSTLATKVDHALDQHMTHAASDLAATLATCITNAITCRYFRSTHITTNLHLHVLLGWCWLVFDWGLST